MSNKKFNALITIGGAVAGSLKSAIGSTTSQLGKVGKEVNTLKKNQADLSLAIKTFGAMGKNVDSLRSKYSAVTIEINRLTKAQERLNTVESARLKNRERMEHAKGQVGGAIATSISLGAPIKSAVDFETAMLGVSKQLQGARDNSGKLTQDFFDMRQEILHLGRSLPVTNNELAVMTGSGLKMGVVKEDILGFTQEVVKMGTAFELPYDQLAENMGKIANMYKVPIKNMGQLADTINYLDDKSLSSGADIIDFMQRVGGTASMVKISDKNTAALGSTLLSLGEKSETASTAINAVFSNLGAANTQSKPFRKMVKELGMSTAELEKGMQTDATGTIFKLMDKINKMPEIAKEGGTSQIDAVATLFGKEHWDTFSKLLKNRAELEKQIQYANSSDAKGSMDREFQARMQTTQAQWQSFKNRINEGAINIGTVLLPIVNEIMGKVGKVVSVFTDWANAHPKLTSAIVKTVAALMVFKVGFLAAKLAIFAINSPILRVIGAFTRLSVVSSTLGRVLSVVKNPISSIRTAFSMIGPVLRQVGFALLRTPWGAVAAIAIAAGMAIYKYWDYIKAFFQGFWQGLKEGVAPFTNAVSQLIQSTPLLGQAWDMVSGAISKVYDWFMNLMMPVKASEEAIAGATNAGQLFGNIVGGAINLVLLPLKTMVNLFTWVLNNAGKIGAIWDKAKSLGINTWEKTKSFFGGNNSAVQATPTLPTKQVTPPSMARTTSQSLAPQQSFTNSFTINTTPGQDANQIADSVIKKMKNQNAVQQRSSNLDWGYSQ